MPSFEGQKFEHTTVLLQPAVDALDIKPDGIYVDGTFGRGGHAKAILERLGEQGRLYAFDKDPVAVGYAREVLASDPRFTIVQDSFAMLEQHAEVWGIKGRVDGVLLDLGVSSPQLDDSQRGFSFRGDGPLDMRMDPTRDISAAEWIASAPEAELTDVIRQYGEERFAKRIAHGIVAARETETIQTTKQLADIVAAAVPKKEKHKHPATRTFQAIRIFINRELEDLKQGLQGAVNVLALGGKLVVISFHSLEDRIVKQFIQKLSKVNELPLDLPVMGDASTAVLKKAGKMIKASEDEVKHNVRARSACLRIAEKVNELAH
jgi:16S rRNA (cytosine1402-N4)-methyltransferase